MHQAVQVQTNPPSNCTLVLPKAERKSRFRLKINRMENKDQTDPGNTSAATRSMSYTHSSCSSSHFHTQTGRRQRSSVIRNGTHEWSGCCQSTHHLSLLPTIDATLRKDKSIINGTNKSTSVYSIQFPLFPPPLSKNTSNSGLAFAMRIRGTEKM